MTIAFSLVIPALNEKDRLPEYLDSIRSYLPDQFADEYEVIVVDDGSTDGSKELLKNMEAKWPQFRCLRHPTNRGKGAAVRTGMLAARGRLRLFADADGAAPIGGERQLREAIDRGADVAIGSRLVHSREVECRRDWVRTLVGRTFAGLTRRFFSLSVRDTQCGFKMFRADVADRLFEMLKERAFLFDLELLILAECLDYQIAEVAIDWSDVPGSRMSLWREGSRLWAGFWRLRQRQRECKLGEV